MHLWNQISFNFLLKILFRGLLNCGFLRLVPSFEWFRSLIMFPGGGGSNQMRKVLIFRKELTQGVHYVAFRLGIHLSDYLFGFKGGYLFI